ncbi:MAG: TOBE domain-containing protein [Desulfovibrionaceae bacterium]|nr:TOBE domain-containing protein [Desulfovibrionaceae bacterium]MBF0514229.1 TOBE domain-containing protein [Desulfovibrionaceae bacterium]
MTKLKAAGDKPDKNGRISSPEARRSPEAPLYLSPAQLSEFYRTFERWYKDTNGPATRKARGRVWLVYLVLRASGAKLGETLALDDRKDIDLANGLIHFGDEGERRTVAIAPEAIGELRAFLEDPVNADLRGHVFAMDQGHVRRKFRDVGVACDLPMSLANPAALRRYRAMELLQNTPLPEAQRILGVGLANLAAKFLSFSDDALKKAVTSRMQVENARRMSARNTFFGEITRIVTGDLQSEVELATLGGYKIITIITNASLKTMKLKAGSQATAIVKAPWVILFRGDEEPSACARNRLSGKVSEIKRGKILSEVTAELADGVTVCSVVTGPSLEGLNLRPGDPVWVLFKTSSVILLKD